MSAHADPHAQLGRWQRSLLPAGLYEASDGRRSARDWLVDMWMTVIAIAIGTALLASTWDEHSGAGYVIDIALGAASLAALWFRRAHPTAVGVSTGLAAILSGAAGGPGLLALFNAAVRAPWRGLAATAALGVVNSTVFPLLYPGEDSYLLTVVIGLLVTFVVVAWGLVARVRRELVYSLRDRAASVEAEERLRLEQAREAERRRIAREMHDVLAHRVSLLSLHAGAVEFRPDAPPQEIAEAAGVIRASAHAVMRDLREVIGVLRDGGEQDTERPQPTLCDIPGLVEESRAAGMHVTLRLEPDEADVPTVIGRTAYRIVQEGLTNARKHAPAAAVAVEVRREEGPQLVVSVVSRRAVGAAIGGGGEAPPGSGTGIIGLVERVALTGGELRHGADATGDFVLRATLPWTP
jgi:signal transduction histidine kinase